MQEAERVSVEEYDATKLLVISAVGTRPYYRRLGYEQDGPYMARELAA
jgi:elongator complex protein 3